MVLFSMKINCKLKYDCLTYLYWNITLSVELLLLHVLIIYPLLFLTSFMKSQILIQMNVSNL